jgi:hypothetical protein
MIFLNKKPISEKRLVFKLKPLVIQNKYLANRKLKKDNIGSFSNYASILMVINKLLVLKSSAEWLEYGYRFQYWLYCKEL